MYVVASLFWERPELKEYLFPLPPEGKKRGEGKGTTNPVTKGYSLSQCSINHS